MLSPRTIHFSDRGAFWECRTNIASEYLPDGFPHDLASPLVRQRGKFESLWPQIVQRYSASNLTFEKDKLPALSGIARLGYNETGDQYLAGLWMRQIEEQLCWRRWASEYIAKRPPWRAPTWSWASINGKVFWHIRSEGVLETEYAHVLDASTTKYGHDSFGQVTSGVIRLAYSTMVSGYLLYSKELNEPDAKASAYIVLHVGNKDREVPIQLDCLDDIHQEENILFYLLPFLSGKTGNAMGDKEEDWLYEFIIEGIVLRPTGTKGEFSRIGSFIFYKNKSLYKKDDISKEELYEPFLQVLEKYGTATAEAACDEITSNPKHPKERYVITLV